MDPRKLRIYLHEGGTKPPVKMTAYGNTAPATCPSMSNRTSRKGPLGEVMEGGMLGKS